MNTYNAIDLLTLGHVPTLTVEVPVTVPMPVLPAWAKALLIILSVAAILFFIKWLLSEKKSSKKDPIIRTLESDNQQKAARITELEKPNWGNIPKP